MNHENPMEIDQDEIVLDQEIAEARLLKSSANSKTVFVPKVQNMDDYLIKHYKSYILQELNQRLANGQIE